MQKDLDYTNIEHGMHMYTPQSTLQSHNKSP